MARFVYCIALLCLVAHSSATKFTDCGSSGQVSKVEVSNCPDSSDTCILKKGTKAALTIVFQSKSESKTVKADVHGIIGGVPLPFPLPSSKTDGCKSGITCPMKSGETFTYTNAINVKSIYPSVDVKVKWELQDDNKKDIVCVEIPSKIE